MTAACCQSSFLLPALPIVLALKTDALSQMNGQQPSERISQKVELWQDVAPF